MFLISSASPTTLPPEIPIWRGSCRLPGVEYRYPFIDVEPWGTQTIEPIAQLILRPNEADIGKFPNEDAQSLVFDDTNLFQIDKFSGWDRVEGGGRANAGLTYTAQFNQAGTVKAVFGQSYQLFGENSFTVGDITNTGLDSGLDKTYSDYVAGLSYQPNSTYMFSAHARFDEQTWALERLELETRANYGRLGLNFLYGDYAAQPLLGFLNRRQGFIAGASYKLTSNWVILGRRATTLRCTNSICRASAWATPMIVLCWRLTTSPATPTMEH